jgi:hypothetical protein
MFFVHRRFYGMMIKSDQTYTLLCSPTNKNPERFRFGVVLSEFSTSRYRRRRPASNPETTASIAAEGAGMVFVSSTVPIELMKWCESVLLSAVIIEKPYAVVLRNWLPAATLVME